MAAEEEEFPEYCPKDFEEFPLFRYLQVLQKDSGKRGTIVFFMNDTAYIYWHETRDVQQYSLEFLKQELIPILPYNKRINDVVFYDRYKEDGEVAPLGEHEYDVIFNEGNRFRLCWYDLEENEFFQTSVTLLDHWKSQKKIMFMDDDGNVIVLDEFVFLHPDFCTFLVRESLTEFRENTLVTEEYLDFLLNTSMPVPGHGITCVFWDITSEGNVACWKRNGAFIRHRGKQGDWEVQHVLVVIENIWPPRWIPIVNDAHWEATPDNCAIFFRRRPWRTVIVGKW